MCSQFPVSDEVMEVGFETSDKLEPYLGSQMSHK